MHRSIYTAVATGDKTAAAELLDRHFDGIPAPCPFVEGRRDILLDHSDGQERQPRDSGGARRCQGR